MLPEASVSLLVPLVFTDAAVRRDRGTVTDAAVGTEGQRARARARARAAAARAAGGPPEDLSLPGLQGRFCQMRMGSDKRSAA